MTTPTLGQTLRAWRQRVTPVEVGLPAGRGMRRTPGLRREELAWLAGVSPDYVQRLEQDRAHPSSEVVQALARALRVSRDESDLLARLAGHASQVQERVPRFVTPGLLRLADRLGDVPLAVYDASWTLLTANHLWVAVFGDVSTAVGYERNVVWQLFTGPPSRIVHEDVDHHERALLADLRQAAARYPQDRELASMVRALRSASDRFARLWGQPDVDRHAGQRKTVRDTAVGDLTLDCDVLTAPDADLRLVVLTAATGSDDADKLAVLGVLGLEDFAAARQV